jgi:integrase
LARLLVERYRNGNRFCFRDTYSTAYNFNKAVNKGLKRIGAAIGVDNLQFYAARHTWATIARNDCQVAFDTVAMALCHSQRTVTDIYIRRDFSAVDAANDRVLSYCFSNI